MPAFNNDRRSYVRTGQCLAFISAALFAGCIADEPGLFDPAGAGVAGLSGSPSSAGVPGVAGSAADSGGQNSVEQVAGAGNSAGSDEVPSTGGGGTPSVESSGGTPSGGSVSSAGEGGADDDDLEVHIPPVCTFHSASSVPEEGAGGAPSAPVTITVQLNAFVGSYLADAAGRTLYTYGADLPGDCNTPPQSLCTADCLVSWPPFDAGARGLPEGLSDDGFGTIQLLDGSFQTTYMGWPLYYYKSDLTLGQFAGQGKGKLWHAAETVLPSVTIMKAGAVKYLADGAGRTLYVSAADQASTGDSDPVSNCSGTCLATFEGLREKNLTLVTSLEPLDFSVFVRPGTGSVQVAYKGLPLYRAATDLKSGDMNGVAIAGFTAALP